MFGSVPTLPRTLDLYSPFVPGGQLEQLVDASESLRRTRLRVLSGAADDRPAEAAWLVSMLVGLGVSAQWLQARSADEFDAAMRHLPPATRGERASWPRRHGDTWRRYNQVNADLWEDGDGVVLVEGPEAAGVRLLLEERSGSAPLGRWMWRTQDHLGHADEDLVDFLEPYLDAFAGTIWADAADAVEGMTRPLVVVPALDPLSGRNLDLSEDAAHAIMVSLGVDLRRPIVCQVGFHGGVRDALAAIEVWDLLRQEVPGTQVLLLGRIEGTREMTGQEACLRRSRGDADVHLLPDAGNLTINAAQRCAMAVLQCSEVVPAGLEVAEAAWKGRAVVAGPLSPAWGQLLDGVTGFVAASPSTIAERVRDLVANPDRAEEVGRSAQGHIRSGFLVTRALADFLQILR